MRTTCLCFVVTCCAGALLLCSTRPARAQAAIGRLEPRSLGADAEGEATPAATEQRFNGRAIYLGLQAPSTRWR